ncbi:helix-turn-helix domain-containing protein (plasmid) [Streptomyces globisporus]|uniref:hypothetical protein n=1 Tax=Streptomyces globisporus TaxID=1908 RepID=UPI002F914235|nr:helix-turn-helix domain-containing protein [Streptomyces globisporus]
MLPKIEHVRPEAVPASILSRSEAASMLGVSVNTLAKLLDSGFLPGLNASWVTTLLEAPEVRVTEGVLPVLRTGSPAVPSLEGDTREAIGAGADMDDAQFLEASRQWWRCDADVIVAAGVLPVAVAGWVVGVLTIHGVQETRRLARGEVRHAFAAEVAGRVGTLVDKRSYELMTKDPAVADLTARLLGARVQHAVSGGPIAYLAAP